MGSNPTLSAILVLSAVVKFPVALAALAANRAFVTLAAAMMAMIVAAPLLERSVLYDFKSGLNDEGAGRLALASMMTVSAVAVPLWMVEAWRSRPGSPRSRSAWARPGCSAGASAANYMADATPSAAVLATMRLTISIVPLGLFVLSAVLMLANPLRKGEYARLLAKLR